MVMYYCSECGSKEEEMVCSSCGNDLTPVSGMSGQKEIVSEDEKNIVELPNREIEAKGVLEDLKNDTDQVNVDNSVSNLSRVTDEVSIENKKIADNFGNLKKVNFQIEDENHLGKGLIKPSDVEVTINGFHFRYEKPVHDLKKTEATPKSKFAEYKVANPEFLATVAKVDEKVAIEKIISEKDSELAVEVEEPETQIKEIEITQFEETQEEEVSEPISDKIDELCNEEPCNESPKEECLGEVDVGVGVEEEPLETKGLDIELPVFEKRVIYRGRFTWYGVPLPSSFQITNQSIVLVDQNNHETETRFEFIAGVFLRQNWIAKLLGIGDILLSINGEIKPLVLSGVVNSKNVVKMLEDSIRSSYNG